MRLALPALMLVSLVACKPDAAARRARWNQAVTQRDGAAAWKVLDGETRRCILDGLKRSQAKAKGDAEFRRLFAGACAPADSSQSPEALAQALIARLTVSPPPEGSEQGKGEGIWPPVPVGYCTPDGCPLTLALRDRPVLPPPAGTSYRIEVDPDGKTTEEIDRLYASDIQTLAPRQHWEPDRAAQAARVMALYFDELVPREAYGLSFDLEGDASLTAVFQAFNRATYRNEAKAEPRLAYMAWPGK